MSIHRSLKVKGGLVRARNVLTRVERIAKLRKDKKLSDADSVFGLPKVKVVVLKVKKKEKKAPEPGDAAAAAAAAPAPAAAAGKAGKAAKPAK